MFRIKVCGITLPADAELAAEAGADAIGLNFYARSPRCVTDATAAEILAAVPPGVARVGVFVNETAPEICRRFDELGLEWIQLHGDEPPGFLAELGDRPILRAVRGGADVRAAVAELLAGCQADGRLPEALLVDAPDEVQYGGTGRVADWTALRGEAEWLGGLPLVLAGGLTPENVAIAIGRVGPAGVDVASGVESSPGIKDADKVGRFVAEARAALESV